MAIGIYFDGRRLIRPQAVTKIDDTAMFGRGLGGANVLALIGEATGGEPGKVQWFTDPSYAKAIFRSGPLLQAIQRAYDPSADVNGAYMIGAIRVNHFTGSNGTPCTQASLTLTDSSFNPLIVLTSVDYGIWNNQIRVRVEDGSPSGAVLGNAGKKVTVSYGTAFDQGDNIGRNSIYFGFSDPKATAATYTISKATGLLTTLIAGGFMQIVYDDNGLGRDWLTDGKPIDLVEDEDYLYVGSDQPFRQIDFITDPLNPQGVIATLIGEYWNGSYWIPLQPPPEPDEWTDNTSVGGVPLIANGSITFRPPSGWQKWSGTIAPVSLGDYYWIRLKTYGASLTPGAAGGTLTLGRGLSVTLSLYPYIQDLMDYLEAQPHYLAGAVTTKPDTELSSQLDDKTGDMLAGVTTLSSAYVVGTTTLAVASTAPFAKGDYITISDVTGAWEEARRITSVGTLQINIDSALSYPFDSGDIVRKASILTSNLQALIEWFNTNSAYVTAAYSSSAVNRAPVRNIGDTYLTGGSDGVTTQADWDAALELLQVEDVHLISCASRAPSVWASLSAHCSYMSTVGKKERIGFCGGFSVDDGYTDGLGKWANATQVNASINQMIMYAKQLNSDRMVYVGPGFSAYDENGTLTAYSGAISSALVAGMAAGVDVAEALTHKSIKVIGLEYNFKWADLDRLLEGGVCPLEFDPGHGYRVCQSITTWLRNDKYSRREMSVRRTADYVARQVRERLERDFVGSKGTQTTLISIKNATVSVLTQMYRLELLAGNAENPPFKNIQCRLEGDTCYVDFECSPVIPINYIPITIHLTVFTTTLTA